MHTFTLLKNAKRSPASVAFGHLNTGARDYIEDELDIVSVASAFGGINKQYISLAHFSLNPGIALKRVGASNVD